MNGATWNVSYGDAANYARNTPPSGFRFIAKGTSPIQIGDFPIWDRDNRLAPSGHIAVVSNIFADGNTYEVVEANITGRGEVTMSGTRRVNGSDFWATRLLGWYRKI
jgi:surface antigen